MSSTIWNIDASHASVHFVARHMVITKVRGAFKTLPLYTMRGSSLHVGYANGPKVPAKIAAFRDFAVEAFARAALSMNGRTSGRGKAVRRGGVK